MTRTYRALAALIAYPTEALQAATGEIAAVLAEEGLLPAPHRAAIDDLLESWPDATSTNSRSVTSRCSIAAARCRCTCSSMCMAKAAIAGKPWPI